MSRDPEQQEETLQHEADRVKPAASKHNVMSYLVVLFGAAFLLLLMTYFMQQRTSQETIDGLKQSMTTMTTLKSIEELQAENQQLQEQLYTLQTQMDKLQTDLDTMSSRSEERGFRLTYLIAKNQALNYLNQIRALYNQRKNTQAREVLALADSVLDPSGGLEAVLSQISADLTAEEREIYDPLEAYQTILGWLN